MRDTQNGSGRVSHSEHPPRTTGALHTSNCYLYAIVHAETTSQAALDEAGPGLRDAPLQMIVQGELAALVSAWYPTHLESIPAATEDDVWRHEHIIEAMMERGPTLPVRFGTILVDAARVMDLLSRRREAFEADLAHVAGRVEMGLRVIWIPPMPTETNEPAPRPVYKIEMVQGEDGSTPLSGSGKIYLQMLAAEQRRKDEIQTKGNELAAELNERLQSLAADVQMQILQSERMLLSAAYLIEKNLVDIFHSHIESLRLAYPNLSFLSNGPWPAYHFVNRGR